MLAAVSDDPSRAFRNWIRWKEISRNSFDYSRDELRIVPMAWNRNGRQALASKEDALFRGWFKKTHYQNTLLLHQTRTVAKALTENRIPHVFLKGVPIIGSLIINVHQIGG